MLDVQLHAYFLNTQTQTNNKQISSNSSW
jgi:hypothetical protein